MGRGANTQGCGPWGRRESDTLSHSAAAACGALRCRALYSDVCLPVSSCPHREPALPSFTDGETEARGGHVSCWMSHRRGGEADLGLLRPCQGWRAALLGLEVRGLRLGHSCTPPALPPRGEGWPGRGWTHQGGVWAGTAGAPVRTASSSQVSPPHRRLLGYTGEPSPQHRSLGAPGGSQAVLCLEGHRPLRAEPPQPPHPAPSSEQGGQDAWGQGWSCCPAPGVRVQGPVPRCSVPNTQCSIPSTQCSVLIPVLSTRHPVSSTQHLLLNIQCPVFSTQMLSTHTSTQYLVLNTQYPVLILNVQYLTPGTSTLWPVPNTSAWIDPYPPSWSTLHVQTSCQDFPGFILSPR